MTSTQRSTATPAKIEPFTKFLIVVGILFAIINLVAFFATGSPLNALAAGVGIVTTLMLWNSAVSLRDIRNINRGIY